MKNVVETANSLLIEKRDALVDEVKDKFSSIIIPSESEIDQETMHPCISSPKTAYWSIGGGVALLALGANIDHGKVLSIGVGVGAIIFGAFKLFHTRADQNEINQNIKQVDINLIMRKINDNYNELYSSIMNEWDDGLNTIKEQVVSLINNLSLDSSMRSKAMNVIRSRSIIEVSTLDLLNDLNQAGRGTGLNALQNQVSIAENVFIQAINTACQKQMDTYNSLMSI
ncbi:MAG: hypothetical protein MJY81_03055 [Bacteroidaceae bacterium]|nr:hypothetical protein [Bacteroidaceae bacterium]